MRRMPPDSASKFKPENLEIRRTQIETFMLVQRFQRAVDSRTGVCFREAGIENLTPAQANVLMVLFQRRRPMSAREIHRELGLSEVTISRLVSLLVRHGWVHRKPHQTDGRKMMLEPTQHARAYLPVFMKTANVLLEEMFDGFEESEIIQLHALMVRIGLNFDLGSP